MKRFILSNFLSLLCVYNIGGRSKIDWDEFRTQLFIHAIGAETFSDTYEALRFGIRRLGDGHSFLSTPEQNNQILNRQIDDVMLPHGGLIRDNFGYILIPGFGGNEQVSAEFAIKLQGILRELDSQSPCGWIVDLRTNNGGSIWAMLAGIEPLIGNGVAGQFIDAEDHHFLWGYENSRVYNEDYTMLDISNNAYQIETVNMPIAVLTSDRTASSGEAIVIAFQSYPDSRSFGRPTGGLSTANSGFDLSDGAVIALTTAVMASSDGESFGDSIYPDQETSLNLALSAAMDWIASESQTCNLP
ncbi:MAG: hypothetical protein GY805_17100 [Chloroflexi bacterium]|nr:hypothetical protein [Chloroflexota bacterium]